MTEIKISDIKWGDRAREEYGDITELSNSISRLGVIQPIVLDENNKLLAGGRRVTACILLKKPTIPFVRLNDLSEIQKLEVELEENLRRKDLSWSERVKLTQAISKLKQTLHPDWSPEKLIEESSKLLNISASNIYKDIELAKAIESIPDLTKEKDRNSAYGKLKRIQQLRGRELALSLSPTVSNDIKLGDTTELIKSVPDGSIDLILFDPPYGVNFDKKKRLSEYRTIYGDVGDNPENINKLTESIIQHFPRIMKPDGHCYIFGATLNIFKNNLYHLYSKYLTVHPYLLFWVKHSADNKLPLTRFTLNYEPFFFCHLDKPRPLSKQHLATFNYNSLPSTTKQHPAQKPLGLYRELIELSTIEGETVFDPMMGSGVSLVAAKQLNRKIIGFELVEDWFNLSKYNIDNYNIYSETTVVDKVEPTHYCNTYPEKE